MTSSRILVTGGNGLLGPYIREAFEDCNVTVTSRTAPANRCDLTELGQVKELIERSRPDTVLHLAALTNVDLCEAEPEKADLQNRQAVAHIVNALPKRTFLAYISTDQVYSGTDAPFEEGQIGPINVYGKSKLAGEVAALSHGRTICFRTNLFGPSRTEGRSSLSDFVVSNLSRGREITVFDDIFFSPLHMRTLSAYLRKALDAGLTGVFNLGCREGASKAEFAFMIAKHLGLSTATAAVAGSDTMPGRAPRPADMRMDVARLETALDEEMPTLGMEVRKL